MCGVVGFVSNKREEESLREMLKIQSHRGPDANGIYIDEKYGLHLGHNRLSIQDVSSHANQPFYSECQEFIIIFNGEVYNFQDIKKELLELNHTFVSSSDTEVILYAYKEWGIDAVEKFIGMFAFAIYDLKKAKLFIVRDRAGVKPLYYTQQEDSFLFSSELKSFSLYPTFQKEINREIIPFYFQFAYIPAPHTIYQNCYKLEAGHYLEYDLEQKSFEKHKYWDINDYYLMDKIEKSEEEILEELEVLLKDACQLRMVSDVPVGVFLSGGYDSSTVASLLQQNSEEKINTFTIGFEEKEFNEAEHAKKIANYLGTNHTEYYCTQEDMLNLIEQIPLYFDEPFADASALPTMVVSQLAKKDVTVALSADGGDESFFGYSKYFAIEKMRRLQASRPKKLVLKLLLSLLNEKRVVWLNGLLPQSQQQTNIVNKFQKFKSMLKSQSYSETFIRASSKVSPEFLEQSLVMGRYKSFDKTFFKEFETLKEEDFSDQMMAVDYKTFMADDVLTKVDRATMSVSLEGREPLLDHRIAEYMARIPLELKYREKKGKYLLRKVLNRYLPIEMTDRPKSGFSIPLKKWLLNELRERALEALKSPILLEDNIIKREVLDSLYNDLEVGILEQPKFVWLIMSYVAWREKWK